MCGRYTLTATPAALAEHFELDEPPTLAPRYNVAPSQAAAVVRQERSGRRRLEERRWGLVPRWARDPEIGARLINARVESVAERPAYREAFRRRRCLVPADGFYEWRGHAPGRQPWWLHLPGRAAFAIAGLYEHWEDASGAELDTFTLLTTAADEQVRPLHDRMPLILAPEAYAAWLDPERLDPEQLAALLDARRAEPLERVRVDRRVNDPRNDDPACLEPEPQLRLADF